VTAAQRAQIQKLLEALIAELSGKGVTKIAPNRTSEEDVGGDEDEQPLNEMLQAIASNRNRNTEVQLLKAQKALARLKSAPDEFGECEECNEEIGMARLKAMPYADLCVACQGKRDSHKGPATRKKITDYR
jgi:DnaK suppressor protein